MKNVPQRAASATIIAIIVASSGLLAACASQPEADALPATGAAATSGTGAPVALTGSRIPARRSEKMVSQIGGKDYKETADAQPAPLRTN